MRSAAIQIWPAARWLFTTYGLPSSKLIVSTPCDSSASTPSSASIAFTSAFSFFSAISSNFVSSMVVDPHSHALPRGAGATTLAVPPFSIEARKQPYWCFTTSSCE